MATEQRYDLKLVLLYIRKTYSDSELKDLVFDTDLEGVTKEWTGLAFGDMARQLLDYARRIDKLAALLDLLRADPDRGEVFGREYEPRIRRLPVTVSAAPDRRFTGAEGTRAVTTAKTPTAPAEPPDTASDIQKLKTIQEEIKDEVDRLDQALKDRVEAQEFHHRGVQLHEATKDLRKRLDQGRPRPPLEGGNLAEFLAAVQAVRVAVDEFTEKPFQEIGAGALEFFEADKLARRPAPAIQTGYDKIVALQNDLKSIVAQIGDLLDDMPKNVWALQEQCKKSRDQVNALKQGLEELTQNTLALVGRLDDAVGDALGQLKEKMQREKEALDRLDQSQQLRVSARRHEARFGDRPSAATRARLGGPRYPRPPAQRGAGLPAPAPHTRK